MPTIFNPWVILGFVLTLGVVGWQAYDFGVDHTEGKYAAAALKQAQEARAKTKAGQGAVENASAKAETQIEHVRVVTRTIIQKVPIYVTPETDRRFPLSVGFVRVHDAAARGVDVSAIPLGSGQSDGSASPIAGSTAASVIADNYGACHETEQRLIGLQSAWRDALVAMAAVNSRTVTATVPAP